MIHPEDPKAGVVRAWVMVVLVGVLLILMLSVLLSPALKKAECVPMIIENQTGLWCPDRN